MRRQDYLRAVLGKTIVGLAVHPPSTVHEIGPVIAQSVHDFCHNPAGLAAIKQLQSVGINPVMEKEPEPKGGLPLADKSVVVTGTLEKFERKEIEDLIRQKCHSPEFASSRVLRKYAKTLQNLGDRYFAERANDLFDLEKRILRHLLGSGGKN